MPTCTLSRNSKPKRSAESSRPPRSKSRYPDHKIDELLRRTDYRIRFTKDAIKLPQGPRIAKADQRKREYLFSLNGDRRDLVRAAFVWGFSAGKIEFETALRFALKADKRRLAREAAGRAAQ